MKYLLFIISLFMIASCDSHDKPTDNISFGQAFSYATTLGAYWLWVIVALVASGAGGYFLYKDYRKTQNWSGGKSFILVVLVAVLLASFLATPATIAANTTVEKAARGVYIR